MNLTRLKGSCQAQNEAFGQNLPHARRENIGRNRSLLHRKVTNEGRSWDNDQPAAGRVCALPGSLDLGQREPLGVDSKRAAGGAGHELMASSMTSRGGTLPEPAPGNLKARAAQHGCGQGDGRAGALAYLDQASPGSGTPQVPAWRCEGCSAWFRPPVFIFERAGPIRSGSTASIFTRGHGTTRRGECAI